MLLSQSQSRDAATHLLVHIKLAEYLCRVQKMGIVHNPRVIKLVDGFGGRECDTAGRLNLLLDVPAKEGQVEDQGQPVSVDKEEEGQESVYSSFGNDVGVQAVAKVNRVDVVTVGYLH